MTSVGVRELRQRASELLRRVGEGETIEVTDRGHPVAVLSPPPEGSPLERLRALGEIEPATADLDDLPEPYCPVEPNFLPRSFVDCAAMSAESWPRISTLQPL
jgi:prevent-host-death family protein